MMGLMVNPHARAFRRHPRRIEALGEVLGAQGRLFAPGTPADLLQAAVDLRDTQPDVVAICGGDGTGHRVLTALVRAYGDRPLPPVALLGGGTMNTIARSMGVRGRPEVLLARLASAARPEDLPAVDRWLTCVDGSEFGFLFGTGMIAQYLEAYYEGEPGPLRAAWVLARAVLSSLVGGAFGRRVTAPVGVHVEVDGTPWPLRRWLTVGIGTVDDLGLGFRAFHLAVQQPGRLHVLGVGCSAFAFAFQLRHALRGEPFSHPSIHEAAAEGVWLRSDTPIGYSLDGDFHRGGQSVHVTLGPRLRCIVLTP